MAAVTQNSSPEINVNGSFREQYYNVTVVTTGDTLSVGINDVVSVSVSPNSGITGLSVARNASGPGSIITFTGTGANLLVAVTGH
jgi:hypothetical protein